MKIYNLIVIIIVVGGLGFALKSVLFETTGAAIEVDTELSGKVIALDPSRAMAGAKCHFMGGRYMGDCVTREINFEAWKYDWSEPTITVKSGELIKIIATSRDVSHGIAIPEVSFNMRIVPGRETVGQFMAPSPGVYTYGCSVMCGSGHGSHKGKLVVV